MAKDVLVSVICDDIFSMNWMCLLLVRDWRTRLIGEFNSSLQNYPAEKFDFQKPDIILVDLDSFACHPDFMSNLRSLNQDLPDTKLVFLSSNIESRYFNLFDKFNTNTFGGFLLKSECIYSLGWAATFVSEGSVVYTPTTFKNTCEISSLIPENKIIIKSRVLRELTDRQNEIARLAIIFSIGRRDLADELKISDQWSYGIVSELYEKLGLDQLVDEEQNLNKHFDDDPIIKSHIDEIISELGDGKKARDLETLAFHLLTMPIIE